MTFIDLMIISLALALDAFGVALCIGINPKMKIHNKLFFTLSFGFFQFILSLAGGYFGVLFSTYITSVPKIFGGIIIAFIGVIMVAEGMKEKECNILLDIKMYFILGVSVSIDALFVGFTVLNNLRNNFVLVQYTMFIGVVALIMSAFAFFISKYLKKIYIVEKYADYIGGIILILFGLKIMFF